MIIGFDATPAIEQQAGIGRYARELLQALVKCSHGHRFNLLATSEQADVDAFLRWLPPGAWREARRLPISARTATILWQRLRLPIAVDQFLDSPAVFHGPDFVVPPTKCPSVVTVHDTSYLKHPEFGEPSLVAYLQRAVPRSLQRAAQIICVSNAVAMDVAEAYPWTRDRLVAIPNGVHMPTGDMASIAESNSSRPNILMVGTIQPRKNHLGLLQAARIARERIPDLTVTIVGRRGWQSVDIARTIGEAISEGWANWIDDADDQALECAYAQATVVACPSFDEGFGLPVIEAQLRGVVPICSDLRVFREVAGDAAIFAAPRSAGAIAEAIIMLINDADRRASLAELGKKNARRFRWEETARRTMRVYERAVGG